MYVTGLDRGVRPIGLWSTSTTSEIHLSPDSTTPVSTPGSPAFNAARIASNKQSWTSVDLPEPETPVMQVIMPSGISTSMFLRLCFAALRIRKILGPGFRRCLGIGTFNSPLRYLPVSEGVHL